MHAIKSVSTFYHLELTIINPTNISNFDTLPPTITPLIEQFAHLFQDQQGLPPVRHHSHHISLIPNSSPINVCPYRYPHFQKNENLKLLQEMLPTSIIKHALALSLPCFIS